MYLSHCQNVWEMWRYDLINSLHVEFRFWFYHFTATSKHCVDIFGLRFSILTILFTRFDAKNLKVLSKPFFEEIKNENCSMTRTQSHWQRQQWLLTGSSNCNFLLVDASHVPTFILATRSYKWLGLSLLNLCKSSHAGFKRLSILIAKMKSFRKTLLRCFRLISSNQSVIKWKVFREAFTSLFHWARPWYKH